MQLSRVLLLLLLNGVWARSGLLVAVGVYNTSTSCPSSCDCPDQYDGISLYLYQVGTSGELSLALTFKAGLNVSWAVSHPSLSVLYTLSEVGCYQGQPSGAISAWSMTGDAPRLLSRLPSGGSSPVHMALTAKGEALIVSNYLGNVSVFALGPDGALLPGPEQHPTGFGTHSTALDPSMQFAFTPILGEDRILQWQVKGTKLVANPSADSVQLGADFGPRHMAFLPSFSRALVADEGSGNATRLTVCGFDAKAGILDALQTLSVTNLTNFSSLFPSEVVVSPDARFVYVSVRDAQGEQDSIAVLSVGSGGDLTLLANTPTEWYPRSMALVPTASPYSTRNVGQSKERSQYLLVGAQKAQVLQVFAVDSNTGLLTHVPQDIRFSDAVAFVGEI